eukprot:3198028-Rhodomonas_salina.1
MTIRYLSTAHSTAPRRQIGASPGTRSSPCPPPSLPSTVDPELSTDDAGPELSTNDADPELSTGVGG